MVIYDEGTSRFTQYSSDSLFNLTKALEVKAEVATQNNSLLEEFTDRDYERVVNKDFRAERYRRAQVGGVPLEKSVEYECA